MRHKTLTGEDRRRAGPTTACQQILRAPQENAAHGACKYRKKQSISSRRLLQRLAWSKQLAHLTHIQSALFLFKVRNLAGVAGIWLMYANVLMVISII